MIVTQVPEFERWLKALSDQLGLEHEVIPKTGGSVTRIHVLKGRTPAGHELIVWFPWHPDDAPEVNEETIDRLFDQLRFALDKFAGDSDWEDPLEFHPCVHICTDHPEFADMWSEKLRELGRKGLLPPNASTLTISLDSRMPNHRPDCTHPQHWEPGSLPSSKSDVVGMTRAAFRSHLALKFASR